MWQVKATGLVSRMDYTYNVDLPPSAGKHEVYNAACVQHGKLLIGGWLGEHLDAGFGTYTVRLMERERTA